LRLLPRSGPRQWRLQLKASEMASTLAQPYRCIQASSGVSSLKLALQFPRSAEKATKAPALPVASDLSNSRRE